MQVLDYAVQFRSTCQPISRK